MRAPLASMLAFALTACAAAEPMRSQPSTTSRLAGVPEPTAQAPAARTIATTTTIAAEEASPEARGPSARRHGRAIDLDVNDADLHDVCALIAEVAHVNIVVATDAHPKVTTRLHRVPWDVALDAIVRSKGLVAEWEGAVIVVRSPSTR